MVNSGQYQGQLVPYSWRWADDSRRCAMADDDTDQLDSDGWPAELVEMRDTIQAELAQREASLIDQRSRYPVGANGWN